MIQGPIVESEWSTVKLGHTSEKLDDALTALFESQQQASADFCGEQREWHLPRLNKAVLLLMEVFPQAALRAMERAKTPYGDLLQ